MRWPEPPSVGGRGRAALRGRRRWGGFGEGDRTRLRLVALRRRAATSFQALRRLVVGLLEEALSASSRGRGAASRGRCARRAPCVELRRLVDRVGAVGAVDGGGGDVAGASCSRRSRRRHALAAAAGTPASRRAATRGWRAACSASASAIASTRWYSRLLDVRAVHEEIVRSIRTASVDGETVSASEMTAWCCRRRSWSSRASKTRQGRSRVGSARGVERRNR